MADAVGRGERGFGETAVGVVNAIGRGARVVQQGRSDRIQAKTAQCLMDGIGDLMQ